VLGENVHLSISCAAKLSPVCADPAQIGQVLINLALNAREAMPGGGELKIETREVDLDLAYARAHPGVPPGRYLCLMVHDTGGGMTPEVQARLFEPFFSTRTDSSGLGLAVVDGIVKQSGGHVTPSSSPKLGTTFNIYLPAATGSPEKPAPEIASKPPPGNETILLVEDEDSVRQVTVLLLKSLRYRVLAVASAEEAIRLMEANEVKIDLLFSDVVMPGMSGRELVEQLRKHDPSLKVLLQSGYTEDRVIRNGILTAEFAFLQKPFSLSALAKKVREVLDQ
jgi:two-component system, cell cycle sensor histidine kinase and response regulator CckA